MAKVLILSGAGLSAESGISTFRDQNGLWERYDVMEVCSTDGYAKNPKLVQGFYDARRQELEDKKPNTAHEAIARLQAKYGDEICVMTQNVDDMLERAGCKEVVHLHGTLTHLRCKTCAEVFYVGYTSQEGQKCPKCQSSAIRHDVVMFGEAAPLYAALYEAVNEAKLLVVIGTSGQVIDTAYFAKVVALSVLNNLDPDPYHDAAFETKFYEPATHAAPKIEALVEAFLLKNATS